MTTPIATLDFRVQGRFKLEVHKEGQQKRTVAEFDNLITDSGLKALCSGTSILNAIAVGSGSTTPATTDTKLATFVATIGTTNVTASSGGSPNYGVICRCQGVFDVGAAAGNLTEVAVTNINNSTTYITSSRALILDGSGNPTTITVLSDEYLTVTYNLTLLPNLSDVVSTIGTYTLTMRPASITTISRSSANPNNWCSNCLGVITNTAGANLFTGTFGAVTTIPSGTSLSCTSLTNNPQPTSFYVEYTAVWNPASGAFTAKSFTFSTGGTYWQVSISPDLVKTSSDSITITIRVTVSR